jgi:hypothetical protein
MSNVKGDDKLYIYLNTNKPFENYRELVDEEYFVDKTSMITLLNQIISTKSKYICVTRPRRFGKSSVADMVGAYYSKAADLTFIVELKKDELPEVAINQIREKEYVEKIKREDEGKKVLAVAICYDSKSEEHRCKIQEI